MRMRIGLLPSPRSDMALDTRSLVLDTCLLLLLAGCCMAELPQLDVSGFSWAENLCFDGHGSLFVADSSTGILWRVYLNDSGTKYLKEKWVSSAFKRVGGMATTEDGSVLYVNAKLRSDGLSYIMNVNTTVADTFEPLVEMPALGNGLALHYESGTLYATNEGDFLPFRGVVYGINTQSRAVDVVISDLMSTDGCWVDNSASLLYFSDVVRGAISRYDIEPSSGAVVAKNTTFTTPTVQMIDDFCVDSASQLIYAADFHNGTVVVFNADGSSTEPYYLMTDLVSPTSVRFGLGDTFNTSCVYVTEGGGLLPTIHDRSVLQAPYSLDLPVV